MSLNNTGADAVRRRKVANGNGTSSSSSQQNQLCNNVTINLLMGGIAASTSIPHDNSGAMRRKRQENRAKRTNQSIIEPSKEDYERWNSLDIELYNYASKLIKLDCEFYQSVLEE